MPTSERQEPVFPRIVYPTPFYARTRFLPALLILGVVYAYGWRVTGIDLGELTRDFHLVKPLIKALAQPDLINRETESMSVEASFVLEDSPFPQTSIDSPKDSKPVIFLSSHGGKIGASLMARGFNLRPDAPGKLFWVNSIGQEFPLAPVTTDSSGRFALEMKVPEFARGDEQKVRATLTWSAGGWRVSHTLVLSLEKMLETLFLALMATTLSIFAAIPLSFLGARNLMTAHPAGTVVYYAVRTFFNVLRSIEPLILAILFAVWVGIGPFAGVLALGFHSIAALGKLYSEQIESIDPGPVEAITATGATPMQVVLYGVIPQIVPQFLAFTFYRWDINVRMSTIIGFVGGGGIGFLLQQWINLLKYNEAGTALLVIAVVVIGLDTLSAKVREKIA